MEKNYETYLNPEQQRYIKEKLFEKHKESFEKYGMTAGSDTQICNLAEFLIAEHPEKYARTPGDEQNYRNNEDLQKIFTIISKEKNMAIMINTTESDKLPEGEFGAYDLQKNEFILSEKLRGELVKQMGIGGLNSKNQDEIIHSLFENDLDAMDKLATIGVNKIIAQKKTEINRTVDEKIDEENRENGKTKAERTKIENQVNDKEKEKEQREEEVKNSRLPEHVVKYCIMAGIAVPKAVIDTKAVEAADKIDEPHINRNGGNVTIIKVKDDSKETDKYLVFQDGRLIIPGNRDDKIDKVVGRTMQNTKDGRLVKPLEIDDEEQYFEYEDSEGTVIREKLEESVDLSIEDLEDYKKKAKIELEKFSDELYKIDETPFLNDNDKDKLRIEANERFNTNNKELATKYHIHYDDMKEINLATDKTTQKEVDKEKDDEPEAWEVPGKIKRGE